jgi:hypothetical protein
MVVFRTVCCCTAANFVQQTANRGQLFAKESLPLYNSPPRGMGSQALLQ